MNELSVAGIEAVIEGSLELRDNFLTSYSSHAYKWYEGLVKQLKAEKPDLIIAAEDVLSLPRNAIEPVTSREALALKTDLFFEERTSRIIKFKTLDAHRDMRALRNIFIGYASADEIRGLYKRYDDFMASLPEKALDLKIEDPSQPMKSIAKFFNTLAQDIDPNHRGNHFNTYLQEHIANEHILANTEAQVFIDTLRKTAEAAFEEFQPKDLRTFYSALSVVLERSGYRYTPGQVQNYFIILMDDKEKQRVYSQLPEKVRIGSGLVANPHEVVVPDRKNEAFAENQDKLSPRVVSARPKRDLE